MPYLPSAAEIQKIIANALAYWVKIKGQPVHHIAKYLIYITTYDTILESTLWVHRYTHQLTLPPHLNTSIIKEKSIQCAIFYDLFLMCSQQSWLIDQQGLSYLETDDGHDLLRILIRASLNHDLSCKKPNRLELNVLAYIKKYYFVE